MNKLEIIEPEKYLDLGDFRVISWEHDPEFDKVDRVSIASPYGDLITVKVDLLRRERIFLSVAMKEGRDEGLCRKLISQRRAIMKEAEDCKVYPIGTDFDLLSCHGSRLYDSPIPTDNFQ